MKRYFATTEDYNCIVYVDSSGKAIVFDETAFDEPLTLDAARAADFSNCDGCETVEEIINCIGVDPMQADSFIVCDFNPGDYKTLVEF